MKNKKGKKWYENEKDLGTKLWFNQAWFAVWLFSLVIGIRSVDYFNNWEGYVLVIFSVLMLLLQLHWQWERIDYLESIKKKEVNKNEIF